ncbi:MAG: hypothetical protein DRQ48_01840 [Gammaproteobacteria bacterium]|nr:MAG: hypothetical protein DRQ48_01840 [Gammaproteobacteria bacterium]
MQNPVALDIETAPRGDFPQEYALQPWRYNEGAACITCISVARASGEALLIDNPNQFRALLKSLKGKTIVTWNGIFDVAWLIAYGFYNEVNDIKWVDGIVLWKWLDNSQKTDRFPKWSLGDGAKRFFPDAAWLEAFVEMKNKEVVAGENDAYWKDRAKLDSVVTAKICQVIWEQLSDRQRSSSMITMSGIVPVARSWWMGVPLDYSLVDELIPEVTREMEEIEFRLGVHNHQSIRTPPDWTPSKILRSTKQLGDLLFNRWKLTPKTFSEKTGAPSTDKASLTYLADDADQVTEILRWRMLNTQLTKYIQTPLKAREYLGSDTVHPAPKLFSTYTGRMTYTSKTSRKYATGVAMHQWPRNKAFRAFIVPLPGYKHVEYDASGQESRLMADASGDINMRNVFREGKDFHSVTGARIAGMNYEDFIKGKERGNITITGEHGFRYQGKFTGLSNNFRIGIKKLRIQARVQYGMDVDWTKAKSWQDAFFTSFPGIKTYWSDAIKKAKYIGYAETLAGRRFKLIYWDKANRWSTESSAIMTPIQGSGADMKDLAIQEMHKHFPNQIFWFDLHDGLHYQVPVDTPESEIFAARTMLNELDYKHWWGYDPSIPLTWDASEGKRWSELKEL